MRAIAAAMVACLTFGVGNALPAPKPGEGVTYYSAKHLDIPMDRLRDCVIPISGDTPLEDSDIAYLWPEDIAYARNEILARHGYIFTKRIYKDHFAGKGWYKPGGYAYDSLSQTERDNIAFLKAAEDTYAAHRLFEGKRTASFDLDGDGKKDDVRLRVEPSTDRVTLSVNRATLSLQGPDGDGIPKDAFLLLKIDDRSPYIDIAVPHTGSSDCPYVMIYRYDGKTIRVVGDIDGGEISSLKIDGSGAFWLTDFFSDGTLYRSYRIERDRVKTTGELPEVYNLWLRANRDVVTFAAPGSKAKAHTFSKGTMVLARRTKDGWIELLTNERTIGWLDTDRDDVVFYNSGVATFDGFPYRP